MNVDIEEQLARELRAVADGVRVPPLLPAHLEPPRGQRPWQPILIAAAVVLIVALAVTVAATLRGGDGPDPAPPSPNPTESTAPLTRGAPTVPYVVDERLYVDGERVPGLWARVWTGTESWLGWRSDTTWWWGTGPEAHQITDLVDTEPAISPNGRYLAYVDMAGRLTLLDLGAGGEELGSVPVDLGDPARGSPTRVTAVTDDGRVIAQGVGSNVLWLPLAGGGTADLSRSAPETVVLGSTPAGLVVTQGEPGVTISADGESRLAEISDGGEVAPTDAATIPAHDHLAVSPGAEWLAWAEAGSTAGEVFSVPTLSIRRVDGSGSGQLTAPDGWAFSVGRWAWESDDHLVAPVTDDTGDRERMARCSPGLARCVLIDGS